MTPMEYILIDIANTAGYDKLSYEDRISKAKGIVESVQNGSLTVEELMSSCSESPFELRNAINAYLNNDDTHVVGLDAVNQALQLYGVLTGDLATASLASLGVNSRTDAYQILADELNNRIGTTLFNRKNCKKGLMVTLYGSMFGHDKILEAMEMVSQEELAIKVGVQYTDDWFKEEFESAMYRIAPKAMEAMKILQDLNNENIGTYNWTLPDGFIVKYDVKSVQNVEVKRKSRGGVTFTYSGSHKVYAPSKYNRGMSPNIIHSIDGYIAREMVRRAGNTPISLIHDQFNSMAKHCAMTQQNYKDIMCEILESDLLNNIIRQINPNAQTVKKSNTLTRELIQQSDYCIS